MVVTTTSSMEPLSCPLTDDFSQRTMIFIQPAESKASRETDSASGILGEMARRPNSICAIGFQDPCSLATRDALCPPMLSKWVISFFFLTESYSIVRTHHIFFI